METQHYLTNVHALQIPSPPATTKAPAQRERLASPAVTVRTGADHLDGVRRWRELGKLHLRALRYGQATRTWLATLNSNPAFQALATIRPRLIAKVHRPYFTNTLTPGGRVRVLQEHYEFVVRHGLEALCLRAARTGVTVAAIGGRSGAVYRVELRAVEPLEREAELVLRLFHDSALVYSIGCTFFQGGYGPVLGVGCIQGPQGESGRELVRQATRELHGLRPKHLLLKALCVVGAELGCVALHLVGNGNRAVRRAQREGKVHCDYDGFWEECGATRRNDGDYHLACRRQAPLDLSAVPSNKRSAARKRHELVGHVAAALATAFRGAPAPAGYNRGAGGTAGSSTVQQQRNRHGKERRAG